MYLRYLQRIHACTAVTWPIGYIESQLESKYSLTGVELFYTLLFNKTNRSSRRRRNVSRICESTKLVRDLCAEYTDLENCWVVSNIGIAVYYRLRIGISQLPVLGITTIETSPTPFTSNYFLLLPSSYLFNFWERLLLQLLWFVKYCRNKKIKVIHHQPLRDSGAKLLM